MEPPQCPGCRERDARIADLEARVAELEGRLNDLTKALTPPRPMPAQPKAPAKQPTGKKPGGQPGHPPHLKTLLPAARVKDTIHFRPAQCGRCQRPLPADAGPDDPPPLRHQVAELPALAAEVTEYQGHARTCPGCGEVTRAPIPEAARAHSVGPRLSAALAYLAGCHGVSKRGLEEITEALFQVPIALGTIANLEQEMSAALAPAQQQAAAAVRAAPVKYVDETGWKQAAAAVRAAPVKYVDETGWKQAGRKRWLWAAVAGTVVVFLIDAFRNVTALRKVLGPVPSGIIGSDRWSAYDHVPLLQRQVCWAHLKRNWEKLKERGGAATRVADGCLAVQRRVFELWHLYRGGGCTWAQLDERIVPLMFELLEPLRAGLRCRDRKTRRFCARVLKVYAALWTFATVEGVEPTNNGVEQVQRRAVLWRRRSFGCHSAAGCRFVERILTVVQTLRAQQRSVLQYLYEAISAHRSGTQSPTLVVGQ